MLLTDFRNAPAYLCALTVHNAYEVASSLGRVNLRHAMGQALVGGAGTELIGF